MKKDQQTRNRFVELRAQGWSYERIAKELGVSKQTGNVLEWVADWYDGDYYQNAPSRNPKGPDFGTQRVLRGGSWYNYPGALRSSNRCYDGPAYRVGGIGFRCSQ